MLAFRLFIVCVCFVCVLGEDCLSWMVPISICTSEDPSCSKIKVLLDQPELTVTIPNLGPDKWVKVRSLSPCMSAVYIKVSWTILAFDCFFVSLGFFFFGQPMFSTRETCPFISL